ncbi:maleylpyruvate isomerase N-terminal domain-containing protein, partial [Geodermatophilus maliterrae]
MSSGPLAAAVALLTRSTGYALEGLAAVTDASLDRPTPCPGWDVRTLVLHLADSADGLAGLAVTGELRVPASRRSDGTSPAAVATDRLLHLLGVLTPTATGRGRPPGSRSAGRRPPHAAPRSRSPPTAGTSPRPAARGTRCRRAWRAHCSRPRRRWWTTRSAPTSSPGPSTRPRAPARRTAWWPSSAGGRPASPWG